MPPYVLSHKAYLSLLLHAAKHPHKAVNGVLLGKSSEGDAIEVVATVPLLHAWTSLSPMMEIGLDLVGTIKNTWSSKWSTEFPAGNVVRGGPRPKARRLLSSLS
jgi:hypothetical protein